MLTASAETRCTYLGVARVNACAVRGQERQARGDAREEVVARELVVGEDALRAGAGGTLGPACAKVREGLHMMRVTVRTLYHTRCVAGAPRVRCVVRVRVGVRDRQR